MNISFPKDNKLVRTFVMKKDKKEEFFHTSGYADAQNAEHIGTASTGLTMEERKAIEDKRKFVQKYNNSKIFSSTFAIRHAKKYTPRTEGGANAIFGESHNRMNSEGDANGNVRIGFGRTSGGSVNSIGEIGGASGAGQVRGIGQINGPSLNK